MKNGHLHPSTLTLRELVKIFEELGFEVYEGPEVDDEWHNFDALNVPADHPARDEQDTFWLKDGRLLRTHTSNCQVRAVKDKGAPLHIVIPGRCFRNEATDQSHETTFYQLEGLYIDKNVTVANLFWVLEHTIKKLYGENVEYRFRPHHYPFVEPGYDIDIKMGSSAERNSKGWMELVGSGMVHPKVLKNMGLDPEVWSGFAFGFGPDRMMMKKYKIQDIRQLFGNDLRFLRQF
jgi:phenylalanyl-tRNA synthetase alpha chain